MRHLTYDLTVRTADNTTVTKLVTLEIDEDAIFELLGKKAIKSKSGKSIAMGGLLKARVVRK